MTHLSENGLAPARFYNTKNTTTKKHYAGAHSTTGVQRLQALSWQHSLDGKDRHHAEDAHTRGTASTVISPAKDRRFSGQWFENQSGIDTDRFTFGLCQPADTLFIAAATRYRRRIPAQYRCVSGELSTGAGYDTGSGG
jgi:hypothetical protein